MENLNYLLLPVHNMTCDPPTTLVHERRNISLPQTFPPILSQPPLEPPSPCSLVPGVLRGGVVHPRVGGSLRFGYCPPESVLARDQQPGRLRVQSGRYVDCERPRVAASRHNSQQKTNRANRSCFVHGLAELHPLTMGENTYFLAPVRIRSCTAHNSLNFSPGRYFANCNFAASSCRNCSLPEFRGCTLEIAIL